MTKSALAAGLLLLIAVGAARAQDDVDLRFGSALPPTLQPMMQRGATFLVNAQGADGKWMARGAFGSNGTAVNALCVLALLSTGEDPNYGQYAPTIRRGLVYLLKQQDAQTGMPGGNSYDFSFMMLTFAEAYGVVDDELLLTEKEATGIRTLGEALQLCVKAACSVADEPNLRGRAWSSTAGGNGVPDTSTGGSLLVALLAARNAGVEVPDAVVDKALKFFREMTRPDGTVAYFKGMGNYGNSVARSNITVLVMSIGKCKQWPEFETARKYVVANLEQSYRDHPFYGDYYKAQALFQSDYNAWQAWNRDRIRVTQNLMQEDGSIGVSPVGAPYSTAMSMLTLALNYRFLPIYER